MSDFSILHFPNEGDPDLDPQFFSGLAVTVGDLGALKSKDEFDAVVLGGQGVEPLVRLRSDLRSAATPIFATSSTLANHPLSDGALPKNPDEILKAARARQEAAKLAQDTSTEAAILGYLWRLDTRRLSPSVDLGKSEIYSYPILNSLGVQNPGDWLARAERHGLIELDTVIDRTRNCASCLGAHLNYVDRCPYCDALEIFPEQAIHCFTCGHVAEQGAFHRGERLVCPKCQTALKHIGTDYDRPIERMRCGDCDERFNDAQIKATCLECGAINAQSALGTRTYRSYRIGPGGETLLRTCRKPTDTVHAFGEAVSHEQFLWTLNWLNSLTRTSDGQAVVARIDIRKPQAISDQDLAEEASLHLQMGALLAPSEVLHDYDPETILVLLPNDGETRLSVLVKELETISGAQIKGAIELAVEGVALPLPEITSDGRAWLGRFAGRGT